MDTKKGTAQHIVTVAEKLLQERGWNGWSYADISQEIGIQKASIHYHFASKEALGLSLIRAYQKKVFEELKRIQLSKQNFIIKLEQFFNIFESVLKEKDLFCLCGMLVADFYTLPNTMREELLLFFDALEEWLTYLLKEGSEKRELNCKSSEYKTEAKFIVASLEGVLLMTRIREDKKNFSEAARFLLDKYRP